MPEISSDSDVKYSSVLDSFGHRFGFGTNFAIPEKLRTDQIRQAAIEAGWSNGCPSALELTDPNNLIYGPEWMLKRYTDTNFWFRRILDGAQQYNNGVYSFLSTPVLRLGDEPVGHFEIQSVPSQHKRRIYPMSSIFGYASSRIFVEMIGKDNRTKSSISDAEAILIETLIESRSFTRMSMFLAIFAEKSLILGAEGEIILSHVYPSVILEEENIKHDYRNLAKDLEMLAPNLFSSYIGLSELERRRLEIADIP